MVVEPHLNPSEQGEEDDEKIDRGMRSIARRRANLGVAQRAEPNGCRPRAAARCSAETLATSNLKTGVSLWRITVSDARR